MVRQAMTKAIRTQLLSVVVLIIMVLLMGGAYWFLTRPVAISNQTGERDRNYLFSIYGFEGDLLRRPTGVGIDSQGNIHVADTGKRRIVVFDESGGFVTSYGDPGDGATQLMDPIDVAVTPTGRSFVVDKTQSKIVIYDDYLPVDAIIFQDEAPLGVTVTEDQLFVTTESGVVIGDLDGNFETGYVARGKEPGEFDRPAAVAVGEDGTLYIADTLNYRVQAISSSGEPLWQYGEPLPPDEAIQFQSDTRKFGLPSSIALGSDGRLYVIDGMNSEIIVLDTDGQFVESFGTVGHDDGFFYYPDGIDYADGKLVIADKFNDRIQVFTEPSSASALSTFVPYVLVVPFLPVLALPFLLRRRRYVVVPDFIAMAEGDPAGAAVLSRLKRLHGAEELGQYVSAIEDVQVDWRDIGLDEAKVADLMEAYGLTDHEAAALYITTVLRGKHVLLTESATLREAAEGRGLPSVTFDEIKESLGGAAKAADTQAAEAASDEVVDKTGDDVEESR